MPIYGILAQPLSNDDPLDTADEYGNFAFTESPALSNSFIKMSHVKYLEQGGARIVPVSYRLNENQISNLLSQLNGIYIPGDSQSILENERYLNAIKLTLQYAQNANLDGHFPLVAMGYGYIGLMMQGIKGKDSIVVNDEIQQVELNLSLFPNMTYMFDAYNLTQMESILNQVTFDHSLSYTIPLHRFYAESVLSTVFAPIATINNDKLEQENEYVALVEGAHFPFFASALSLEKIQFSDATGADGIDHGKQAVKLA